ncbi:hypothetical protein FQR65_LT12737 [Abscondita terminalis]|nr:hypothetical protein FQR65_LT12737 [Abscondita terminalis]
MMAPNKSKEFKLLAFKAQNILDQTNNFNEFINSFDDRISQIEVQQLKLEFELFKPTVNEFKSVSEEMSLCDVPHDFPTVSQFYKDFVSISVIAQSLLDKYEQTIRSVSSESLNSTHSTSSKSKENVKLPNVVSPAQSEEMSLCDVPHDFPTVSQFYKDFVSISVIAQSLLDKYEQTIRSVSSESLNSTHSTSSKSKENVKLPNVVSPAQSDITPRVGNPQVPPEYRVYVYVNNRRYDEKFIVGTNLKMNDKISVEMEKPCTELPKLAFYLKVPVISIFETVFIQQETIQKRIHAFAQRS